MRRLTEISSLVAIILIMVFIMVRAQNDCCPENDPECQPKKDCASGEECCLERPNFWAPGDTWCLNSSAVCSACPVYNPNHPENYPCPKTQSLCCSNTTNPEARQCWDSKAFHCCSKWMTYDSWACPMNTTCCGDFGNPPYSCCDSLTEECSASFVCQKKKT